VDGFRRMLFGRHNHHSADHIPVSALLATKVYKRCRITSVLNLAPLREAKKYLIRKILQLNLNVRHTGRDCRYPEHREVNLDCPPWLLDSGNPCRNDEYG